LSGGKNSRHKVFLRSFKFFFCIYLYKPKPSDRVSLSRGVESEVQAMLIIIIIAAVLFAAFMLLHSRHRKPAAAAVANMILGAGTLALLAPLTGTAVNLYTLFCALALGVPGTALVVLSGLVM
jgi:hypothetical protein